jgi:hypothetical protein
LDFLLEDGRMKSWETTGGIGECALPPSVARLNCCRDGAGAKQ